MSRPFLVLELPSRDVCSHVAGALTKWIESLPRSGMAAPPELADIADIARAASVATLMDSKGREGTFPRSAARASDDAGDAALVDREEAARWLGVSVRTVTRLANDGRLTKVQLRGAVRYRLDELVELATAGSS